MHAFSSFLKSLRARYCVSLSFLRSIKHTTTFKASLTTPPNRPPNPRKSPLLPPNLPLLRPILHHHRAPQDLERSLLLYVGEPPFTGPPAPTTATKSHPHRHLPHRPTPTPTTPLQLPRRPPPLAAPGPLPPFPPRLLENRHPILVSNPLAAPR